LQENLVRRLQSAEFINSKHHGVQVAREAVAIQNTLARKHFLDKRVGIIIDEIDSIARGQISDDTTAAQCGAILGDVLSGVPLHGTVPHGFPSKITPHKH
jgi:hypothetical protein